MEGHKSGYRVGAMEEQVFIIHRTAFHVDGLPEVMLILVLELLFQYPPLATAPPKRCLPSKEHLVLVPCLVKRDTGFPVKDERGEPVGLVSDEASWVRKRTLRQGGGEGRMSRRNQVKDKRLSVEAWLSWEGRGGQSCLEISKK